jgi:uncharacterized membrane protein YqgA involved in biofilm formation
MIGTLINAVGILAGGIAGANPRWQPAATRQQFLKVGLGVFTVYAGLKLVYGGMNGTFGHVFKQFLIVLLAMSLGKLLGRMLGLQKASNRLGEFARERMTKAKPGAPGQFSSGFLVGAALFCAAPLSLLGALQDGLQANWHLLAIKAVMDGLAVMAFVPMFGRGVMLAVVPVVAWQGVLTLGARTLVMSGLVPETSNMLDSLHITCGLLAFSVSLIVLEVKKIELADYLPCLALAPLLTKWWLG